MSDLDFQQLSTVQNLAQQKPVTIASATSISPSTFLTHISGTVDIATIIPPVTGAHLLILTFTTGTQDITETGNILIPGGSTLTPAVGESVLMMYDPNTASYTALILATTVA